MSADRIETPELSGKNAEAGSELAPEELENVSGGAFADGSVRITDGTSISEGNLTIR